MYRAGPVGSFSLGGWATELEGGLDLLFLFRSRFRPTKTESESRRWSPAPVPVYNIISAAAGGPDPRREALEIREDERRDGQ